MMSVMRPATVIAEIFHCPPTAAAAIAGMKQRRYRRLSRGVLMIKGHHRASWAINGRKRKRCRE